MAEGRFISRNIAFSEQLGQISMEADYLFMRMLPHLDCEGRITGSPTSIRARVCPLRKEMSDGMVSLSIAELDQNRLIVWYEVDGMQCIEYPNFEKYQTGLRKNREAPSKIPASTSLGTIRLRTILPIQVPVTESSGIVPDNSGSPPAQIKERKEKLREEKLSSAPSVADVKSSYVQEGVLWWTEHVGRTTHPRFGAALKPVVEEHGWEIIFPALQRYVAEQHKLGKTAKVEWFIADLVRWIRPRTAEVDEQGDPTSAQLERWARL